MPLIIKRIIFFTYLLTITIVAVFPFSAANLGATNQVYVMSFRLDHLLHVLAFIPLYPLVIWLFRPQTRYQSLVSFLICMLIAASAEYIQYFLNYRAYNPVDLISNLTGALLGFLAISLKRKLQRIA